MATCNHYWTAPSGGTTMLAAHQNERLLLETKLVLSGHTTKMWLTEQGTGGAPVYFSSSSAPWPEVMVQESGVGGKGGFGQTGFFGPMLARGQTGFQDQYQVLLRYDGSAPGWYLEVFLIGQQANADTDTIGSGRNATTLALGEG